ncbi:MAG: sialate O-acetylesterase [Armatimonadota bacterium]
MKLASLFCDHAVLQRDLPITVWGWAEPGETVTVSLAGNQAAAKAGADGAWRVTLPALPAGGPYEMTVAGRETIVLRDLLIGEVWVCSGQSNMQMTLNTVQEGEEEVAASDYPDIRLLTVPNIPAMAPKADIEAEWKVCSPKTSGPFSAVGYFFGRKLHQELGVPVGLINTSWGGTVAEAWTSREGLHSEPELQRIADLLNGLDPTDAGAVIYQQAMQAWNDANNRKDTENLGFPRGWADPATPDADWGGMMLPAYWKVHGLQMNGVVWFRLEVDVPAAWAGQDLTLSLGTIDKADATYFNNVKVGGVSLEDREDAYNVRRIYTVPGALVRAGRNLVAVRIFSHVWAGGMIGKPEELYLACGEESIPLAGEWRYRVEADFGDFTGPTAMPLGEGNPNTPTVLFNGMIHPLLPFGIRGAIWYQGESNAARGKEYQTLFPTMITDWRKHWGQGDFPFYFVQLANFQAGTDTGFDSQWAELREAQTMTLALPNTGMAVIIDVGESTDIHPKNKQDVGLRLALNALAKTYGRDMVCSGPMFREARVEGKAIRLFFEYAEGGLVSKGELSGFAIAGADRQFTKADAVIDGETVVVSSPAVPAPVAVRYGWAEDPICTLYNQAGLPMSPFRTDDWVRSGILAGV